MSEQVWLGTQIAILAVIIAAAIYASRKKPPTYARAVRQMRLEAKVDALMRHAQPPYEDPFADVPEPVLQAIAAGRTIEAIRLYRQSQPVGLKDAKDFVDGVVRRLRGV